ncbi:hypothetical protein BST97_05490 [Nonlabens spongiae]|uniref:DUF3124 domain-containing protein n=1 Tax=Nonlabens spongiae TaxID=331648 RepID=A0A1W6MPF9_9FLAO|nr:DUF3124 domain-containing protein [Nonlabens spongiae]ARN79386.1 hypothetical protein BST97_05490 [Nonlabens spongiae]
MRRFLLLVMGLAIIGCFEEETAKYPSKQPDWATRVSTVDDFSAFAKAKSYLPIYSHIYHVHDERTFDLTATASIRNISPSDTLYIISADYYDTSGKMLREYVQDPIYVKPMETLEIIIEEKDYDGGSGANFLFEYAQKDGSSAPLFEAVMISTQGQQGLSFTTRGVPVND